MHDRVRPKCLKRRGFGASLGIRRTGGRLRRRALPVGGRQLNPLFGVAGLQERNPLERRRAGLPGEYLLRQRRSREGGADAGDRECQPDHRRGPAHPRPPRAWPNASDRVTRWTNRSQPRSGAVSEDADSTSSSVWTKPPQNASFGIGAVWSVAITKAAIAQAAISATSGPPTGSIGFLNRILVPEAKPVTARQTNIVIVKIAQRQTKSSK